MNVGAEDMDLLHNGTEESTKLIPVLNVSSIDEYPKPALARSMRQNLRVVDSSGGRQRRLNGFMFRVRYATPSLQFVGSAQARRLCGQVLIFGRAEASALPGASESEGQPGPLRG